MSTSGIDRRRALALAGLAWIGSRSVADAQSRTPSAATRSDDTAAEPPRLPPAATTRHTLELPGRTLHFEATAGAILLTDEKHAPRAELAFVAFQSEGAEKAQSPGDVRVQRRAWVRFRLAQCRRGRTMAHCARGRRDRSIGVARTDAECRDLARLHRSGVHRPGRHRLFARAREQSRCAAQALVGRGRHRISRRGDPPLAGPVRPQCLAEIPAGRKLWRLPGAAAGPRTRRQPGNRRLRPGDDIAGARPRRPQFRVRTVRLCDAPALDDSRRACRAGDGDARRTGGCRTLRHDRVPARPDAR